MDTERTILVTGGAGFIGSNFIHTILAARQDHVVNLDKLTYAGSLERLAAASTDPRYHFVQGDVCDRQLVSRLLKQHRPRAIVHFAAESHVDRSISAPDDFIRTNVVGAFHLLEEVRGYWEGLASGSRSAFRFLHVSTDEVYGSLEAEDPAFSETSRYLPNSPYSASKAASDHLVRACHHTYGLPTLTTHCSNNYGPWQFPEKLIPLAIDCAMKGNPIPIYGDGSNVRDWLYVQDHCRALEAVLEKGKPGAVYHIGANCEKTNLEVVRAVCALMEELVPLEKRGRHETIIEFVSDRPGHDRRYAIDAAKIKAETGWAPEETFETGIRKTVQWSLDNAQWLANVTGEAYREWMEENYGQRPQSF